MERQRRLHQATGECLLAWAMVEFNLAQIFRMCSGIHWVTADNIWSSVLSFDSKMSVLHNVLLALEPDRPDNSDWVLLHDHTRAMARRRNEVAHATMVNVEGKTPMLEPFFVISKERPRISVTDVEERTFLFKELAQTLGWYRLVREDSLPEQHRQFVSQVPDLLLRLRSAARQNDEGQRRHAQYLRTIANHLKWRSGKW